MVSLTFSFEKYLPRLSLNRILIDEIWEIFNPQPKRNKKQGYEGKKERKKEKQKQKKKVMK